MITAHYKIALTAILLFSQNGMSDSAFVPGFPGKFKEFKSAYLNSSGLEGKGYICQRMEANKLNTTFDRLTLAKHAEASAQLIKNAKKYVIPALKTEAEKVEMESIFTRLSELQRAANEEGPNLVQMSEAHEGVKNLKTLITSGSVEKDLKKSLNGAEKKAFFGALQQIDSDLHSILNNAVCEADPNDSKVASAPKKGEKKSSKEMFSPEVVQELDQIDREESELLQAFSDVLAYKQARDRAENESEQNGAELAFPPSDEADSFEDE